MSNNFQPNFDACAEEGKWFDQMAAWLFWHYHNYDFLSGERGWWRTRIDEAPSLEDGLLQVIAAQYQADPVLGIKLDLRIRETLKALNLPPLKIEDLEGGVTSI